MNGPNISPRKVGRAAKRITPSGKGGKQRTTSVTSAMLVRDRALAVWITICVVVLLVLL